MGRDRRRWWQRPVDLNRPGDFRLVLVATLGVVAVVVMIVVEVMRSL
jgi:hypothetical protein